MPMRAATKILGGQFMTKKKGIRKTGIIAAGLAVLLLAGTSIAVAAATRPSPEVFHLDNGTAQVRWESYYGDGTDQVRWESYYGDDGIDLEVINMSGEDGNTTVLDVSIDELLAQRTVGQQAEYYPHEDLLRQLETDGLFQFRESSYNNDSEFNVQPFSVTVDESGNIVMENAATDSSIEELLAQRALEREQDVAEALARLEAGWQNE